MELRITTTVSKSMSNEPKRKGIPSPLAASTGRFNHPEPLPIAGAPSKRLQGAIEELTKEVMECEDEQARLEGSLAPVLSGDMPPNGPPPEPLRGDDSPSEIVSRVRILTRKMSVVNARFRCVNNHLEI